MFDFGVRGFGRTMAVVFVAGCGWLGWSHGAELNDPWRWGTAGLLSGLVFFLPIALYMGYYWGSRVAIVDGIERNPETDADEPPLK